MQIIISPAKQMKPVDDDNIQMTTPILETKSKDLLEHILSLDYETFKDYMKCSDKIATEAFDMYQSFKNSYASLAILTYSGIQYQYMKPGIFTDEENEYIQNHLWILSGLYGALRPHDGIKPYRLEMQTKCPFSLYDYWKDEIAKVLPDEVILNLASEEYAKCIRKYRKLIDVRFCVKENGKLKEKGVYAKMARGCMVRFLAENQINSVEEIKQFNELNYEFSKENSKDSLLVFVQKEV